MKLIVRACRRSRPASTPRRRSCCRPRRSLRATRTLRALPRAGQSSLSPFSPQARILGARGSPRRSRRVNQPSVGAHLLGSKRQPAAAPPSRRSCLPGNGTGRVDAVDACDLSRDEAHDLVRAVERHTTDRGAIEYRKEVGAPHHRAGGLREAIAHATGDRPVADLYALPHDRLGERPAAPSAARRQIALHHPHAGEGGVARVVAPPGGGVAAETTAGAPEPEGNAGGPGHGTAKRDGQLLLALEGGRGRAMDQTGARPEAEDVAQREARSSPDRVGRPAPHREGPAVPVADLNVARPREAAWPPTVS